MKKFILIIALFVGTFSAQANNDNGTINYVAPTNTVVIVTNSQTTERIELQGGQILKLQKDVHYFIDVKDISSGEITMLEKSKGKELLNSLFD